ncbi:type I restriction-modification system subunit M [Mycoplasmopsis agassizii]|uniref:site-specific DNA-methyltransferase (adenine-specific) n=1 Tax=Mycoplasmopsis agassizii TaxID=33922 RepID=A0ABX4H433_9BACT|nr:class I SAM-dependent DNA methyltransferase [Mycoplasmopsis agassizii]PAF54651.1 restriction endonuclease subunit M [Mycoplasmopsis agassizii]SMC16174.1 type I restriction enzyme M protein [Mycoplasmopsis agassizii]
MTANEHAKRTTNNIQEKANLIWNIANHLVGVFKPHEYGKVILPLTVIKRFDDALLERKERVLKLNDTLTANGDAPGFKEKVLANESGYPFYNTSKFTFKNLLEDPDKIAENFDNYLKGFSENVTDIISNFKFDQTLKTMIQNDLLFAVLQEFNSEKGDMHPDKITSTDMGYIFEELIRKFSESYNEQAGAHFTSRDIIYLMAELLIKGDQDRVNWQGKGITKSAYDMTMGTSQMLGCLEEKIKAIDDTIIMDLAGQELNPETYAIAKADMLIKGGTAESMKVGNTLSDDQFPNKEFDYIISNPPFGIDWKLERKEVENEHKSLKNDGRFGPGLPQITDGQLLFLLNGVKKLKNGSGRMAIIQNSSSLFMGDAGTGSSNIRKYLIENDYIEAIVQLPANLFYNTGISTYIWVISKTKTEERKGKIQLIDASNCYVPRTRGIGDKRVDLDDRSIDLISRSYVEYKNAEIIDGYLKVESKIFDNEHFGFTKIVVESPLVDDNGQKILKKGNHQPDPKKRDFEFVPLTEDINDFFARTVLPYNTESWIDFSKNRIGYKIPFISLFAKYQQREKLPELIKNIEKLEKEEFILKSDLLEFRK